MRISWLAADDIVAARDALTADGTSWDDHFAAGAFVPPPPPAAASASWEGITEHVARAERVSAVVREHGLDEATRRFGGSTFAIEQATLAAAAYEGEVLELARVLEVLRCPIDPFVFYAPFLELMAMLGGNELERTVTAYEEFAAAYAVAMAGVTAGGERVRAMRDGLADYYVRAGRVDDAEALFTARHAEDQGDVAVALSASRAFLASGAVSRAVRWLGVGAERATALGREDLAERLREKQSRVRERLS
jgi:hypothetical protein